MVAMVALRGTRIRYSRLLVHLVDGDFAGGVEDGEKSSGRCSRGVVDLGQPTRVTGCLYVIFIMFGCFVLLVNFRSRSFSQKKKKHIRSDASHQHGCNVQPYQLYMVRDTAPIPQSTST